MIITLCGSARFEKYFHVWNEVLTLSGHTVFSLAVFPSQKEAGKNWYTAVEKLELDRAHCRKIDASDAIVVLNAFAYLGESVVREIQYAQEKRKKIYFLESWDQGAGVGANHSERWQALAGQYGVLDFVSPMDTNCGNNGDYDCLWDLLPDAGDFKSSLVKKIERIEDGT